MFPILYDSITPGVVPDDYGIGVLRDTISCEVKEERNGSYELKLKYPSSGAYAQQLTTRSIIKAKPNYMDDPQLFRVYKVGKAIGSSFTIYARHISYDLSGYPITTGSANNISDAFNLLQAKAPGYTFSTDKSTHASFKISEPSSVRSWLGGKAGSILDVFGTGDYKYDNFDISFLASRGTDRGVTIRYGKNLTKLDSTDDSSNLVTGVIAFWKSSEDDTVVISDTISTDVTLDVVQVSIIDASNDYEEAPTKEQLNAYATKYITGHEVRNIKKNYKLDFVQISELLKDRVDLCDTVAIIYEDFGISLTAKCISTTWDVIEEKYKEIELGDPKTNIADTITTINKTLGETISGNEVRAAIKTATDIITGNKGGYIVMHDSDGDGEPDELLIMNTPDISTATKVWRWNLSGLGYSKTGYNGQFGLAMTMDGAIVADYVNTGNLIFGSGGNTNGKLEIRDGSGNVLARFDKTGVDVKGHINAQSFTADASNGVTGDILTTDTKVTQIGVISGLAIFSGGKNVCGVGATGVGGSYPGSAHYIVDPDDVLTSGALRHTKGVNGIEWLELYLAKHDKTLGKGYSSYFRVGRTSSSESWHGEMSLPGSDNLNAGMTPGLAYFGSNNIVKLGYAYLSTYTSGSNRGYQLYNLNHIMLSDSVNGGTVNVDLNGFNGNVRCVSLTQTSSIKHKKNVESMTEEEALKLLELRPVTYDFKEENRGTDKRGFIAEEVEEVLPELVSHYEVTVGKETKDDVALDYIEMIPYLTKLVQMQQKQIEALTKRVEELENRKES